MYGMFSLRQHYATMVIVTLLVTLPSSIVPQKALTDVEMKQLQENKNVSYIYCDKYRSKMAELMEKLSDLDENKNSPLWELKNHIDNGFSIGREDAIEHALIYAEELLNKTFNADQIAQISETLNSVIDQISNGQLSVDIESVLTEYTRSLSLDEAIRSKKFKLHEKLYALKGATFFRDVTFKDKAKFEHFVSFHGNTKFYKDVTIEGALSAADQVIVGTLSASDAVIDCDLTVGCNIDMNNSSSAAIGNINKGGASFIHNFGADNTFVGVNAGNFTMTGIDNTAIGVNALSSNTTGDFNTASGLGALAANQAGSVNTANGGLAMVSNINGDANTAVGFVSMAGNQSGNANAAFGLASLVSNTTGNANTALGLAALSSNTTGNANTAVGIRALENNISGNGNISIGAHSGTELTFGNDNIYIANDGAPVETGFIRIGTYLTQIEAYIQGIFGSSVGVGGLAVEVDSTGKLGTIVSANRFKRNITDMDMDSAKIYDLHPVTFSYKNDSQNNKHYGLLAEEVALVFPDLVVNDAEGNPFSVRYQVLPMLLLNEIQKQHACIEDLNARVAALEVNA